MEEIYCNCDFTGVEHRLELIDTLIGNWSDTIYSEIVYLNQNFIEQNDILQSKIDTFLTTFIVFIGLFISAIVALVFFKVVVSND